MFEKRDIHIHVPDGATPKDGPSAGAAMTTAFVSAITGIAVRGDVAMTGEITLRGEVTAIGGLKEKLLAALRGGIKTVIIPEENAKDLQEIPENVKNGLEIVPVKWIDQVLQIALVHQPTPLPDEDPAVSPAASPAPAARVPAARHRPRRLDRRLATWCRCLRSQACHLRWVRRAHPLARPSNRRLLPYPTPRPWSHPRSRCHPHQLQRQCRHCPASPCRHLRSR
jgi:hypothetical protein